MSKFIVVEVDLSEGWSEDHPCDNPEAYFPVEAARKETRSFTELAGGKIKGWFLYDPEDLLDKPSDEEIHLTLVGHLPTPSAVEASAIEDTTGDMGSLLSQSLHLESCEGYGYVGLHHTKAEVESFPVVCTVEAADRWEAELNVRDAENDKEDRGVGLW